MANSNYSTALLTLTFEKRRKKIVDNIFSKRPFQYWLSDKSRIRMDDGGTKIVTPLVYAVNDTVASFANYDPLDMTPQEGISAAEFDWRQWGGSVAISRAEELKNSGESQVLNLLKAKEEQLENSLSEKMDYWMILSDGTGNTNKEPIGLSALIGDANSSITTVGNIDASTYAWWRSYVKRGDAAVGATAGTDAALTVAALNEAYLACARGTNDAPDLELTTETLFLAFEALLFAKLQYQDSKTANAGFMNLTHKGAVVMHDVNVPAEYWYFINSKYLELVGHKDEWFRMRPFQDAIDKNAKFGINVSMGNLTVSNRQKQGLLTGRIPA